MTKGSMLARANKKRVEIYSQIVQRHIELYQKNIIFVIEEKEKLIQELLNSRSRYIISYLLSK
jgi:hypothetical protein